MRKIQLALIAATVLAAATAQAAGDPEAGKAKASICAACHGMDGKATAPIYPNLCSQSEQYLLLSLKAYKAGERTSSNANVMKPMAAGLSESDMENLAAYYAGQKC